MPAQAFTFHSDTPTLTAVDPRGLAVRSVGYCRSAIGEAADARINRTAYDGGGRVIAQWDPRLQRNASAPANLVTIYTLSGKSLSTTSVDAGWRVSLLGEADQSVQGWDGRGSRRWSEYDNLLRPLALFEQAVNGEPLCTERFAYAGSDPAFAAHNLCGQLIRHDDPAGSQRFTEFGLHGAVLEQTRHFLNDLTLPDWPEPTVDREWLLEPGEGATTRSQVNALGEVSHQTDAKGHRQLFSQTLDGQLREVRLQLKGTPTPKTLLSAIHYNAYGQTEREVAGNGVISTLEYDAQNGRLTRLSAQRGNEALQDLQYAYDPVGNVLSIEDAALPIRYFANQRIEPINRYAYDSLSQLIEATGWEAGGANKGPQLSTFDDPALCANYRQTYRYDVGSNLLDLTHAGPQRHGHRMLAAAHSNRCLPVLEGVEPDEDDFRRGFDGNGNLLKLQPGQALAWDLRNQLSEVRPVVRDSGVNDRERYVYGADGMRLRKVRETLAHARTLVAETRYLPNLELRNYSGTGEVLQVISVQAGRSSVRVLHWESAPPNNIGNDQYRYHLNDHLGSCTLELDNDGEVISQERYHPYGTTAWFAGRGEVEASYRTVRYSGKERDATGLYYYGFRYYVAEWQRWLNPDPAGPVDGLNLYAMVRNNPVTLRDAQGAVAEVPQQLNWIWLGSPLPEQSARNINDFISSAAGYSGTLWVDRQVGSGRHAVSLSKVSRNVRIRNISDAFEGLDSRLEAAFERERSGPFKNFASASDIARVALLSRGGVYADVDMQLRADFPAQDAPLGARAYVFPDNTLANGVLAAPANSPVIAQALSSIATAYSDSSSSTWTTKRAFPGAAEIARQESVKEQVISPYRAKVVAMRAKLGNSSEAYRARYIEKSHELADLVNTDRDHFLRSTRMKETLRVTGPQMLNLAFQAVHENFSIEHRELVNFAPDQFEAIDANGSSTYRRPALMRRASF